MSHPITIIDSHPLPLFDESYSEWVESLSPMNQKSLPDEPLHPDEIDQKYVDDLSQNWDWRVFKMPALYNSTVFVWNHQKGCGFTVDNSEGAFNQLTDAMQSALEDDEDEPSSDQIEEALDHLADAPDTEEVEAARDALTESLKA